MENNTIEINNNNVNESIKDNFAKGKEKGQELINNMKKLGPFGIIYGAVIGLGAVVALGSAASAGVVIGFSALAEANHKLFEKYFTTYSHGNAINMANKINIQFNAICEDLGMTAKDVADMNESTYKKIYEKAVQMAQQSNNKTEEA